MSLSTSRIRQGLLAGMAIACVIGTPADARRGGSFGSRGSRTYSAPYQTSMMPRYTAPVQRSMTQPGGNGAAPYGSPFRTQNGGSQAQVRQPGRLGGFGGGLVGGLLAGGLLGSLLGHGGGGWGSGGGGMGGDGFLGVIQLLIIGGVIWFVIGWFRRKTKSAPGNQGSPSSFSAAHVSPFGNAPPAQPLFGGNTGAPRQNGYDAPNSATLDITLSDSDKAAFEGLLIEVQDAFGHEDYARLRAVTTPEIMSYLSEELSQNATSGRRNDVTGTRLIDAEVSEAWREDNAEYATIAMRYASIDVMRDRATGAVIEGDSRTPTEIAEVWTFVRPFGGAWKLSAIQE